MVTIAIVLSLTALLSSCFLFEDHSVAYSVNLWYYDPKVVLEPYCFGIDLKATFGTSTLLDISVDQTDLFAHNQGTEGATSGNQRYYAGMPLDVVVKCKDEFGGIIGEAHYVGSLIDAKQSAYLSLWNYRDPDIDPTQCIPPTTGSGVQLCATSYGFRFQ